jgi:autotransporter-associated beta strand protein/predicted outer membrane repeat protein
MHTMPSPIAARRCAPARFSFVHCRRAIRIGLTAALTLAPMPAAFAAMCDTPSARCEILSDRTYTDPNTYDYTSWTALDLEAAGTTSPTITHLGGTVLAKELALWNSVRYNMSGGTANISGDIILSIWSSGVVTSYINQSGGTMNAGGKLRFALFTGNAGVYTLSGGSLNVGSNIVLVDGGGAGNAKAYLYLNGGVLTANEIDRDGDSVGQQTVAEVRFNGGTLRAKGNIDNPNWINLNNGWNQRYNSTVLAIDGAGAIFDTNGRSMGIQQSLPAAWSLGSAISPSISGGGVTKRGAGTLTLSAGNAYTGNTTVEAGTLTLGNVNSVVNSTVLLNGGTLSFNAITSATLGGLGGSQTFALQNTGSAAVALGVGNNGANTTYSGAMTGTGSLNKIGGGTLTLSGTNTYSGATSVSAGTLSVNGATGSGALAVAANAILAGTGQINGAATIQNNGHLAPGNSPGTLTFTNGLTLNGGAVLDLQLGTSSDLVRASGGTFAAASGVKINLSDSGGFAAGTYTLIDFTGASASGISAANFTLAATPTTTFQYTLSVQGTKLMLTAALPPPVVTSVSAPLDGLYGIGKPLDFTVHFDKPLTVTGTPRLVLTVPALGTQYANYVSGSGTADLIFRYSVASGIPNNASGPSLAGGIDLNGGGLADANNGTAAVLTLNGVPSLAGIALDGTAPTVTSIHLVGTPPPTSVTISYTVTFSESVTGVDATDFSIATIDGTATGQVGTVGGSGSTYTVVVTRIGGVGHLVLNLKASGTGIADAAANAIAGGYTLGDPFQANVQRVCYVSKTAAGANDGTSWTDAYTDLQTGVRDPGCVEVWAAKGVYKPGTTTNASFQPRAAQKLYGGFAGVETSLAQRTSSVIAANPTVMSGDIDGNDTTDSNGVVVDAAQIAGSNSTNVILMNNAGAAGYGADTVIDGFIITGGDAGTGSGGGGLRCDASLVQPTCNFTLSNLVFSGNRAGGGGALSLSGVNGTASPAVSKVLFRGNRAIGAGASGGAVFLSAAPAAGRVSPAFSNVVFSGNTSLNWGGAIDLNVNQGSVTPTFDNATFTGNVSTVQRGGAIASQAFGTGGVARATFRNSILWGDAASAGDPEIKLDANGAVTLDQSILQGGCPGGNAACTNMISGDPKLGTLGGYGGAVPSIRPGAGSAAIDTGTCVIADDIRGIARPQGSGCDIGAVEALLNALTVSVVGSGNVSAGATPVPMSGGISACTGTCVATYDGETQPTVTLTAAPNAQQTFSGWSGDCSGSIPVVTVAMTAARSCTATFVQNTAQTTLTLSGGSNPSVYGNMLTFTASVTAVAPATQTPTGSVSFYDGAALLGSESLAGNGTATFAIGSLNAGSHSITALYGGDANYAATQAPSAPLTQVVNTATPLIAWSAPAAIVYGTPLGAAQLNATASWNGQPVAGSFAYAPAAGSVLAAGPGQPLAVTFTPADATNYTGATASVPIDVTRAALSVSGTVVQNKPYDGNATATLSGGVLVGVVPQDAGSVLLTQAGTFAQANVGTAIAVTASDSISGGAAANYTLTQPGGLSGNITAVPLSYKATAVTIAYGTTPSGLTGTLIGFVAGESQTSATTGTLSFTTTATASSAAGSYAITGSGLSANHGNYTFVQDAGNATALTISAASSTTTLTAPATAVYGQSVTFTATVALPSGNSGTAAGSVAFTEGAAALPGGCAAAVTVSGGSASCTTSALSASAHAVTATFTPADGNTTGSTGNASVTVSAAGTTTTITNTQPWTVTLGGSTTVSVSVAANAPGSGTPTGTVTVSDGGAGSGDHCTISALSNGSGTCTLTPSSAGTKTVTATYTPDAASSANFTGSEANAALDVAPAQTGSTLTSSVNPSVFGQSVIFTATVTPAAGGVTPSGKVHFFIDEQTEVCVDTVPTPTGTANAVSATCTVPQADLSVGDHAARFAYDGDANNHASSAHLLDGSDNVIPQTVNAAQTTTTIATPPSAVVGSAVTVAVTVSANAPGAGIPTGAVALTFAGQTCSAPLDAGGAGSCAFTAPATAGSVAIAASYPGTPDFAASAATASLQVAMATTTTSLTAPAPITLGQSVGVTATVAVNAPGTGTPTGTIAIGDGGTAAGDRCTITLPATSCTLTPSSAGTKTLSAAYVPDAASSANFGGSNANPVSLVVNPAAAGTSLSSSANPSTYGQSVSFTAVVTPASGGVLPTGNVTFSDGETPLCNGVALVAGPGNAAAVCTTSTLSVGSHAITARYSGDANNQPATANLNQVVNKAAQTLTFPAQTTPSRDFVAIGTFAIDPPATSSTPNSGQPIAYSAKTSTVCSVSGTTVTMLAAGTCTIAANQVGDDHYDAATEVVQSVAIGSASATMTLAASTTTPAVDAPVTLTVTVTGQAPTGTTTIKDGSAVICDAVTLTTSGNTATASCETHFATAGSHTLTAAYSGDANNAAQSAAPLTIEVGLKCAAMTLTATPDHIGAGESLTLQATLAGCTSPKGSAAHASSAVNAVMPSGTVTFYDDTSALGQAAIDANGNAALPVSTLSAGTHTLKATYAGDGVFAPTQAQTTAVVEQPAAAPVPAPALQTCVLWLLAAALGLAGAAARSRQVR